MSVDVVSLSKQHTNTEIVWCYLFSSRSWILYKHWKHMTCYHYWCLWYCQKRDFFHNASYFKFGYEENERPMQRKVENENFLSLDRLTTEVWKLLAKNSNDQKYSLVIKYTVNKNHLYKSVLIGAKRLCLLFAALEWLLPRNVVQVSSWCSFVHTTIVPVRLNTF